MNLQHYSEKKWMGLSEERCAQILLQILHEIELAWQDEKLKTSLIDQLQKYVVWRSKGSVESSLSSILNLLHRTMHSLQSTQEPRELLNLMVPLERFLEIPVRDDGLFKVTSQDGVVGKSSNYKPLYIILDHLRSAFNVGGVFRTCECFGVQHLYLVGYTPTPQDQGVLKTAMGTEAFVSWSQHDRLDEVLLLLKNQGVSVVAMETCEGSQSLEHFKASRPLALLFGNERFGLSTEALRQVDAVVKIPMCGHKNSLNVVSALSVSAFEVCRQWKGLPVDEN